MWKVQGGSHEIVPEDEVGGVFRNGFPAAERTSRIHQRGEVRMNDSYRDTQC